MPCNMYNGPSQAYCIKPEENSFGYKGLTGSNELNLVVLYSIKNWSGGQWLYGRKVDLRSRDACFESHLRHCVVSLCKTLSSLLSTGSIQENVLTWMTDCCQGLKTPTEIKFGSMVYGVWSVCHVFVYTHVLCYGRSCGFEQKWRSTGYN